MSFTESSLARQTSKTPRAVTPSDTEDLPGGPANCGLFVTAVGNVSFDCGGITISLTAVAAHTRLPFAATRVRTTGTTATVLACY